MRRASLYIVVWSVSGCALFPSYLQESETERARAEADRITTEGAMRDQAAREAQRNDWARQAERGRREKSADDQRKAAREEELRESRAKDHAAGTDILRGVCMAATDIANANLDLNEEEKVAKMTGVYDAARVHRAGREKVRAQEDLERLLAEWRERMGEDLEAVKCGERRVEVASLQ